MERIGGEIDLDSVSPSMGPFPVEDTFGMKITCTILHRTLDPGKHEEHIQFSTAEKIRRAYSNVYHALRMMKEVSVMAFETNKLYKTTCRTYRYWFERFILGCHKRMGDIVVSDYSLSKALYMELMLQVEEDWEEAYTDVKKDKEEWLPVCGHKKKPSKDRTIQRRVHRKAHSDQDAKTTFV
jgi:hypothetical protein